MIVGWSEWVFGNIPEAGIEGRLASYNCTLACVTITNSFTSFTDSFKKWCITNTEDIIIYKNTDTDNSELKSD